MARRGRHKNWTVNWCLLWLLSLVSDTVTTYKYGCGRQAYIETLCGAHCANVTGNVHTLAHSTGASHTKRRHFDMQPTNQQTNKQIQGNKYLKCARQSMAKSKKQKPIRINAMLLAPSDTIHLMLGAIAAVTVTVTAIALIEINRSDIYIAIYYYCFSAVLRQHIIHRPMKISNFTQLKVTARICRIQT